MARFDRLDPYQVAALAHDPLRPDASSKPPRRQLGHLYGIHVAETVEAANQALGAFIDAHREHRVAEPPKLTETLLVWGEEIVAFHRTGRVVNGRIEGANNKIGAPESPTDRQRRQPSGVSYK